MSEKTEDASPQKIREAREKGEVAKSADLITSMQCLAIVLYLVFKGRDILALINHLTRETIASVNLPLDSAFSRIATAADLLLNPLITLGALILLVTVVTSVAQTGIMITPAAMAPKFDKLNIVNNAKQIFSPKSLVQFLKTITKVTLVGIATYLVLRAHTPDLQFIPTCTLNCGFEVGLSLMRSMFVAALAIMLLISFADLAYERYSFFKKLRMSKEEKKEESKNSEGNPEIKGERKKIHREIQSGSLNEKVRKTSVVLRNPTHFAVCLQYDAQTCPVPKVIEKGRDSAANRIVEMAEKLGVPMIEDVALTRAIFREVAVGEPIPNMFFAPVAAVLRVIEDEKILRQAH